MIEILRTYLCEEILNETNGAMIDPSDDLLGTGLVDSMGMMRLITFIEKRFGLKTPPEDLVLENFSSLQVISDYLSRRGASAD